MTSSFLVEKKAGNIGNLPTVNTSLNQARQKRNIPVAVCSAGVIHMTHFPNTYTYISPIVSVFIKGSAQHLKVSIL